MFRKNTTKEKLKKGELVIGFRMDFGSSLVVESLGGAGFDFVFLDCEHRNGLSDQSVEEMIRTAEMVNLTPIVRVPVNQPETIAYYLEQGAMGVIAPHCLNREVTESLVRSAKYPPKGERGLGGRCLSLSGMPIGDYVREANNETMAIALIEDAEGVDNLNEILSVEGLDSIIVGQYDLSASMGYPGQIDHPAVREAVEKIVKGARAAGKASGIGPSPIKDPDKLKHFLKLGMQYIDIGAIDLARTAAQQTLPGLRDLYKETTGK